MSLRFYYSPMSSSTRVHWALEELGVPYEKVKLDLTAGDQRKPEYLALNPNGKVPLLVDDGTPIFESVAILIHLAEKFGVEKGLYPASGSDRATALKWLAWGSVTMIDAATRLLRNTSDRFPAEEKTAAGAESAKKDLAACFEILEKELEGKEYLVGSSFTFADLAIAAYGAFLARLGFDFNPYKNVNAWIARCMTRPALARAMMG